MSAHTLRSALTCRLVTITAASLGNLSETLKYDPTGRLSQTIVNGVATNFLYDGDQLVMEYDTSNTVLRRYIHGPGVDNPFLWLEGSAVSAANARYLLADRQGSIIGYSDSTGTVPSGAVYTYDSYGAPGAWGGSRFRYTGQIELPEAQLYYYKARVYEPASGRFLQTDPVGYKDNLDLYQYVGDDPVDRSDPSGKTCIGHGESLVCNDPSYGTYTIPKQSGFQNVTPNSPHYTRYQTGASNNRNDPGYRDRVAQQVVGRPTPNNDGVKATPQGAEHSAGISPFSPTGPLRNLSDEVRSYKTTNDRGDTIVSNVSVPGEHMFDPAVVTQVIHQDENGTTITVVGESNGALHDNLVTEIGGKAAFKSLAEDHLKDAQ